MPRKRFSSSLESWVHMCRSTFCLFFSSHRLPKPKKQNSKINLWFQPEHFFLFSLSFCFLVSFMKNPKNHMCFLFLLWSRHSPMPKDQKNTRVVWFSSIFFRNKKTTVLLLFLGIGDCIDQSKQKTCVFLFFPWMKQKKTKTQWTPKKQYFRLKPKILLRVLVLCFFCFWQSVIRKQMIKKFSKYAQWAYLIAYGDYFIYLI